MFWKQPRLTYLPPFEKLRPRSCFLQAKMCRLRTQFSSSLWMVLLSVLFSTFSFVCRHLLLPPFRFKVLRAIFHVLPSFPSIAFSLDTCFSCSVFSIDCLLVDSLGSFQFFFFHLNQHNSVTTTKTLIWIDQNRFRR